MARGDPSAASSLFDLDPDEPLQRLPDLDVRLQSNGSVRVDLESRAILCGPHALRVLETFAHPTTFKDAIDVLKTEVRGTQDWVDLSDTIMNLFRAGVLEPHERASRRPAMRTGFDSPVEHISMLNDRARTGSYLDAIQEVVRPGDVVVELGTGTGVLAVAAREPERATSMRSKPAPSAGLRKRGSRPTACRTASLSSPDCRPACPCPSAPMS
jgi:hypothetical protein